MIGCVGNDDDGLAYRRRLKVEGIDVRGILFTNRALTGTALIAVERDGENTIIVAAGANGQLTPRMVESLKANITSASAILLQFEIPPKTTLTVIRLANQADVPVVLNPSPFRDGFPWGKHSLDTLVVNSGEAKAVFGRLPEAIDESRASWIKALANARVTNLIITRGARPTVFLSAHDYFEVPTLTVKPKDTVGAGDAFAGTLAARRSEGMDWVSAIRLANCAGALATLQPGAQESIPSREATEKAVRHL
jgi:ribokinase